MRTLRDAASPPGVHYPLQLRARSPYVPGPGPDYRETRHATSVRAGDRVGRQSKVESH